jgi:hypothetical protein
MRLFRLKNKSGRQWWIVAPDLKTAKEASVQFGDGRKTENIRLVNDQTELYLNYRNQFWTDETAQGLKNYLDGDYIGIMCVAHQHFQPARWQMAPKARIRI